MIKQTNKQTKINYYYYYYSPKRYVVSKKKDKIEKMGGFGFARILILQHNRNLE